MAKDKSTAAKAMADKEKEKKVTEETKEAPKEKIEKKDEWQEKSEEYLNGWKRCQADFENYKKRQVEEKKNLISYGNINLILDVLPIIDNFHVSTDHVPEDQKDSPWVTGIMHILRQLEQVLTDNGVSEIPAGVGDEFDPEIHEAIENKNDKKEEFKNIIKKIVQKGYKMGTRIIRPARVIVE